MELTGNDFVLLRRYADDRDESAFAELVRRNVDLVHSASLRRIGDRSLAEDVTQATFMILARKAKSIRQHRQETLSGWLLNAVRYAAANAIKMENRRRKHEQAAAMAQTQSSSGACSSDPTEVIVWHEIARQLDDAVLKLSSDHRQAVLLRYFENQPIGEMAVQLQLSEGAVKQRLSRALDKLKHILSKRGAAISAIDAAVLGRLLESLLVKTAPGPVKTACVAAGGAGVGVIGIGTGYSIAKGAIKMMAWTKTQVAASVVMLAAITGAGGVLAIKSALAQDSTAASVSSPNGNNAQPTGQPPSVATPPPAAIAPSSLPNLPSSAIVSDSYVVINIDATKLDPASIQQTVQAMMGPLALMVAPKVQTLEDEAKQMIDAGVQSVTIILSGEPSAGDPLGAGYIKVKPGVDHAAVQQKIRDEEAKQMGINGVQAKELLDMSDDGDFIVIRGKGAPISKAAADADRARQFATAFSGQSGAFDLVFVPTDKIRDEMKKNVSSPQLVPWWAASLVVTDCQSIAFSMSLGDSPILELAVQAADEEGAKKLADAVDQGAQQLRTQADQLKQSSGPPVAAAANSLNTLADMLKPKRDGTKVSVHLEGKLLTPAISGMLPLILGNSIPNQPPVQVNKPASPGSGL